MKTIFSKVKLRPGQIVQLFLLVLLSAVGQMLLPSFLAQMISHGVAEGENRIVWMYAVIMAGVTLFSCVISFLSVKIASYISTDFAAQLRTQVFSKVQEFGRTSVFRSYGRRSQFGSSCRDTGSSDCIDDHHGTGIEVFAPSEKKARSDQQIVFGIVGRSTRDPRV